MPKLSDVYRTPKGRKVIASVLAGGAAVATAGATAAPDAALMVLQALAAFLGG